jgi:peptide/nickel transport system substrate-binding protein
VRRALNYAIDRAEMARLLGQDSHPTCQLLPPYISGYIRYCPYTLNPNPAQTWSAPDFAKAQALIAASGTRGMRITVWSQPSYLTDFTTAGRYLVSLLDRLGYRVRVKAFAANDPAFYGCGDPRMRCQLAFNSWAPNYPAASEFIQFLASCQNFSPTNNSNWSEFCGSQLDADIRAALAAEATNSPTASHFWAQADRQVTDQALFVPLVTPSIIDFVSRRVGNYRYNPQLGVLIDQLWVR